MAMILIVDDVEGNRTVLARMLAFSGHQTIMASSGVEALDILEHTRPDLILLDLSMPGLDGWTVTKHLKAHSELTTIPVIAVTAHAMAGDRERILAAGCDDYIAKPIDYPLLLATVSRYLTPPADQA